MDKRNPLVSIIVRTKDRPELLKRALGSISAQIYKPIEVVLVNDGGCDLDTEELRGILGDVSLNYISLEKNTGRANAGNVGIENAQGDYIGFLDDDDEFYPEHIQLLKNFLEQHQCKVAYSSTEVILKDSDAGTQPPILVDRKIFSKDFSYSDLLLGNYIPFNSILFSRDILRSTRIDKEFDLYEDWDLLIRIGEKYPFCHLRQFTAKYIQWGKEAQINQADEQYKRAMYKKIIEKHREKISSEIILNVSYKKDNLEFQLENLMDKCKILEADIEEYKAQLTSITDKDRQIQQLKKSITEKDYQLQQLEKSTAEKDYRIQQLSTTITLMSSTLGWKMLEKVRMLREKYFPQGSRRRQIYDLGIESLRVTATEGIQSFLIKVKQKLSFTIQSHFLSLKKARSILKRYGFKTFCKYSYNYLIHGKSYFKTLNTYHSQEMYEQWIEKHENWHEETIKKEIEQFSYKPKLSIITPVYNGKPRWLNNCIESVMNQFYENWELCLYDDASTDRETIIYLKKWVDSDSRLKISFGTQNLGISGASNQLLKEATSEFIALLDQDDELSPDALYETVKLLNTFPDTDLIYSDEDKIIEIDPGVTKRFDPFFKPDWSSQLLFSSMYIGHLSVYRKSLVDEVGGFRSEYDFSQDYDLSLRVTEKTNRIKSIKKILYHWRSIPTSAAAGGKDFARVSNIGALRSAVKRRGYDAEVIEYPYANRVKFHLKNNPLISIIIPTDNKKNIFNCIDHLCKNTHYTNLEIIAVTNSLLGREIVDHYRGDTRIKVSAFDKPFNFSLKCNQGAFEAQGEYVLFINDDVEAIQSTWLEDMMGVFGKGNVGGISPKLFYEDDTIQYAGMITGVRGLVGTAFHCQPKDSGFYFNLIQSERNVSILSGACLLMPKEIFERVGGFDAANIPIMHSDIDLCFKLLEKGYELIYTPFASLRHVGHLSLREAKKTELAKKTDTIDLYILKKWGDYLSHDSFYSDNMREFLYKDGSLYYKLIAGRQDDTFLTSKNILFITHDLSLSGASLLLFHLACHFKKSGYFVTVLSPCDGKLAYSYERENIPLMIDVTIAGNPLEETKKFMKNFDLILLNTLVMWQSVFIAKEINTPVLWFIHESLFGLKLTKKHRDMIAAFPAADDIIFIGEATAFLYQEYNTKNNFRVINYGAKALSTNSSEAKGNGKLVLLHVGSIERRKGQDILIQSISQLPRDYLDNLEVYIVGRILEYEFYKRITKLSRSFKNIHFVKEVSHDVIGTFMGRAHIFVCSSRDEVGPLTVLEAMSAGKAIISTDVGGVSVMIRNHEDGIIIQKDNSKALTDSIIYLYNNRQEIQRLGENAQRRFNEHFTLDKFGDSVLNIVNERLK